jgi:hypothetical protein
MREKMESPINRATILEPLNPLQANNFKPALAANRSFVMCRGDTPCSAQAIVRSYNDLLPLTASVAVIVIANSTAVFASPLASEFKPWIDPAPKQLLAPIQNQPVAREQSFAVTREPVHHAGQKNTLNIFVRYTLKPEILESSPPDFRKFFKRIQQILSNYPNENDYWEVVNRNLTHIIIRENPELASLAVTLEVMPRQRLPYISTTTVSRTTEGQLYEKWGFSSMNNPVKLHGRKTLNIYAKYTYKSGISRFEYPDFLPIHHQLAQRLLNYRDKSDSWEMINRKLIEEVLRKHPEISALSLKLEALPTPQIPYPYSTTVTLPQPLPKILD